MADGQDIIDWLEKVGLGRHVGVLMDDNGDFGFRCLSDIRELSEKEVEAVIDATRMNIGERKRFLREVKSLKQEASASEARPAVGSSDTGGRAGATGATARDAGAPQAQQQEDLEALRAELERQREELRQQKQQQELLEEQRRKELEDLERKHEAEQIQQRRQQELLEEQQELLERRRQEQLELQRELEKKQHFREQGEPQAEEGGVVIPQQPPKQTEWFLVVKSMVFVKATPHKDSESLAFVKRGELLQVHGRRQLDNEANQWVELTGWELKRRGGGGPPRRGFALIDGSEMGIGRLLEGPMEPEEPVAARKPSEALQALAVSPAEREEQEEEEEGAKVHKPQLSREQVIAANWEEEEVRLAERWGPESCPGADHLPRGVKLFTATFDFVYVKRSADPQQGAVTKLPCKPGTAFFSTGALHVGPLGGEWIEEYARDGAARWLLVEGPGFQTDGPMLLDEGPAAEHVPVAVHYCAARRVVCLFRTLVSRGATVQRLASRLCGATGLSPKAAMLVPRAAPSGDGPQDARLRGELLMGGQALLPHMTLRSYGFKRETDVFLAYAGSFEEDYRGGALLRE